MFLLCQPCKLPPLHWYFDGEFARSRLQLLRTTWSFHLQISFVSAEKLMSPPVSWRNCLSSNCKPVVFFIFFLLKRDFLLHERLPGWTIHTNNLLNLWYKDIRSLLCSARQKPPEITKNNMSILSYFSREGSSEPQVVILPPRVESGVLDAEHNCMAKEWEFSAHIKRKRKTYREEKKLKIAKYANIHGFVSTIRHFRYVCPNLGLQSIELK